eukprot:352957_1
MLSLWQDVTPTQAICLIHPYTSSTFLAGNYTKYEIGEYNFETNEWVKKVSCGEQNFLFPPQFRFIEKEEILYATVSKKVMKVDLKNKKISVYTNNRQSFELIFLSKENITLTYNNQFHLIKLDDKKHFVWNDNDNIFDEPIYSFNGIDKKLPSDIAHIKSKNIVLFFDGFDDEAPIYEYNYNKKLFFKLNVSLPKPYRVNFGITTVMNEKYILFFGGYMKGVYYDDIFIFSVQTNTFTKSKIKCPKPTIYEAITFENSKRDELIVFGYMRKEWNLNNFSQDIFPPFYLLKLIQLWYWTGVTYLINKNSRERWKINTIDLFD